MITVTQKNDPENWSQITPPKPPATVEEKIEKMFNDYGYMIYEQQAVMRRLDLSGASAKRTEAAEKKHAEELNAYRQRCIAQILKSAADKE